MRKLILGLALSFWAITMIAQPTPGGRPDDGGAGSHLDTQAPLPTSTVLLLALGVGYTACKYRIKKKH